MNFDALRQAANPSQLPPPEPLFPLDRAEVLAAHRRLVQQERELDRAGQQRTRRVVVGGPPKAWSNARLDELRRAELVGTGLRTDETAKGRVLVLRVISEAVRTSGVHFVAEDCEGRVAPVQLYNVQPRWSAKELNAIYKLGSYWALKEPTIRSSSRGYLLRVDSPPDLVRLWPSHPFLQPKFTSPSPLSPLSLSPLKHKDKGNASISVSPLDALEHYSLAIDALLATARPTPSADSALLATLFSNHAAARLKLGQPGRALKDCMVGLNQPDVTDTLKVKLQYRAASACYAMERYADAAAHLEGVAQLAPGDAATETLPVRLAVRQLERTAGKYDWPALYQHALAGAELDIASYAHPAVSVGEVAGKHRALVATAALKPGELLFVQRPLALGKTRKDTLSLVAGANLWTETLDPPAVGQVVADLIERWEDREDEREEIGRLWAGEELGWLSSGRRGDGADVSRFEGIATFNCFHPESLTDAATTSAADDDADHNVYAPSALYLLPSYMNHSCVGNVSYSFLGDVIFARARVPIASGDELVDSYVDGADDLEARREKLGKHGFVCGCELCGMDERDGEGMRERRRRLGEEVAELTDRIHGAKEANPARHLDHIRRLVHALEASHDPARPRLRPAVYPARRLLAQTLADCGRAEEAVAEEVEALKTLGADFAGEDLAALELVGAPRVGDANAVLSTLFVAKQYQQLGKNGASRHWVRVARRIERGQAGEDLFELRYAGWAERHGIALRQ